MRLLSRLFVGVIAVSFLVGSVAWYRQSRINAGHRAFLSKNYAAAYTDLHPFGGWFNPEAETDLGELYVLGKGAPKNYSKALKLFHETASAGYGRGETALGLLYYHGFGVPVDRSKAVYWLQRGADHGVATAEWAVGAIYASGNGLPHDMTLADSWYKKAADQGYAAAEAALGVNYLSGDGVPQDYAKAFALLQRAADQGLPDAQFALGTMYEHGWGIARDGKQALDFFKEAASRGNGNAEARLGYFYSAGLNVPQDYARANKYFEEAADQGNAEGEYNLGVDYLNSRGFSRNTKKAVKLFRLAAEQNYAAAQNALGQLYAAGVGVVECRVLSYMYFNLAVAHGSKRSKDARDQIAMVMTPEQLADAQTLSGKWTPGTPLPNRVSYEDWAPDFVLNSSMPRKAFAKTRVWFSRQFTLGNEKLYAVFLVTKGGSYHAASAKISVVTFDDNDRSAGYNFSPDAQADFARMGSWGDVEPPTNPSAPYTSPARVATKEYNFGNGRFGILVPDGYFGMGEALSDYVIFAFSGRQERWSVLGALATGDDTTNGFCPPNFPKASPCYSWKDTVKMVRSTSGGWPEFVVHRHGTVLNHDNKLVSAGRQIYRYNGKQYVTP